MIRQTLIVVCLLLALATLAVAAFSYRSEIVCHGPTEGITGGGSGKLVFFAEQEDFLRLKESSRVSFVDGAFQLLWIGRVANPSTPAIRTVNGRVFWWRHCPIILLGTESKNGPAISFTGIALNQLAIPLWGPLVIVLGYPVLTVVRGHLRRYRRRKRGLCLTCAYNLIGNTSGVCPECGDRV